MATLSNVKNLSDLLFTEVPAQTITKVASALFWLVEILPLLPAGRREPSDWSIVLLKIQNSARGGNYCATTLHKSKTKNSSVFKKKYMFMAQRFWIFWIGPLNSTLKTEQMLEITAMAATKSLDSPLIKLCPVLKYIFIFRTLTPIVHPGNIALIFWLKNYSTH